MSIDKVLVITTRLPYPMISGAKIRAFHILQALARRHRITIVSFYASREEEKYFGVFGDMGVNLVPIYNPDIDGAIRFKHIVRSLLSGLPLTVSKYWDKRMADAVCGLIRDSDAVYCEHMHMSPYIMKSNGLVKVLDAHNVETQIGNRLASVESNLLKKIVLALNGKAMERYEKTICAKYDMILSVSRQDQGVLESEFGAKCVRLLENGVDTRYFNAVPVPCSEKPLKLVFVGAMDWFPNSDAVRYFVKKTLPLLRAELPQIEFDIVGKNPPDDIRALSGTAGVRVTGTVDDVRPYVRNSRVVVVPLRIGGGSRLKILEAFSLGVPVVSTTVGCEGIECRDGRELLVADDPKGFASCILRLLRDPSLCAHLADNARRLATGTYSWDVVCSKLPSYFDALQKPVRAGEDTAL